MKTRKRKYKLKVINKKIIRSVSFRRSLPAEPGYCGVTVDHSCRMVFNTLIGSEKSLMATKNKVNIVHKMYPNFFVTRKHSKSRMGKGKGKIAGRVMRVHKGEVLFNLRFRHPAKSRKWIKAVLGTLPSTTKLSWYSHAAAVCKNKLYYKRWWINFRPKKKKRPFWQKVHIAKHKMRDLLKRVNSGRNKFIRKWNTTMRQKFERKRLKMISKLFHYRVRANGFALSKPIGPYKGGRPFNKKFIFNSPGCRAGLSGARSRIFFLRYNAVKVHTRLMYEAFISQDADGYLSYAKHTNAMMKRGHTHGFTRGPLKIKY